MKSLIIAISYLTMSSAALSLLQGCKTEESEWQKANSTNSVASYERFISSYPNSQFVSLAKIKIKEIQDSVSLDHLGNVELDMSMTCERLCSILRGKPHLFHDAMNSITACWYGYAVTAAFYGFYDTLSELSSATPYCISISAPFKGSLRGIRVGDSVEKIITIGRRYGNNNFASSIDLDKPWEADWDVYSHDDHRIAYFSIRNKNFVTQYIPK